MAEKSPLLPTRRMKRIFRWWYSNLSPEEQVRLRQCLPEAYHTCDNKVGLAAQQREIVARREAVVRAKAK